MNRFTHAYALIIAVTENQLPGAALPDVAKDAAALSAVLTHPDRCAYPADHVRTLIGKDATRAGILSGLTWLAEQLEADDSANATSGGATAVIYYSGHGWRHDSAPGTGGYFFIPYDVRENAIASRALRAEDFAAEIATLNARRLLVLLDCCHAGGMVDANGMGVKDLDLAPGFAASAAPVVMFRQDSAPSAASIGAKGLAALATGHGRAVLSSSSGDQPSYLRRDHTMSIFTYHVIEALTGHAQPAAGATEVLVSDIMGHVTRRVPESARADAGATQEPEYHVSGNFPVALLLGGKGLAGGRRPPDPLAPPPGARTIYQHMTGSGVQVAGDLHVTGDLVVGDKIRRQVKRPRK